MTAPTAADVRGYVVLAVLVVLVFTGRAPVEALLTFTTGWMMVRPGASEDTRSPL